MDTIVKRYHEKDPILLASLDVRPTACSYMMHVAVQ